MAATWSLPRPIGSVAPRSSNSSIRVQYARDKETLNRVLAETQMRSPNGFPALATAARQRELDQRIVPPCRVLMKDGVPLVRTLPKLAPPPEEETESQKQARKVLDGMGTILT